MAVLATITCALLFVPAIASAATGSISGTVTAASGGAPIEDVEVCAFDEEGFEEHCTLTAANGKYTISGLAPGLYVVEFWAGAEGLNYVTQFYNGKSSFGAADTVPVTSGATPNIDAEMQEGGQIEGKVIDASTEAAVHEVLVCASKESGGFIERCALTDASGNYTIAGLATASYKVEFWAGFSGLNYVTQYYNDKPTYAAAEPVPVTVGATSAPIDAELHEGGRITGTVSDATSGAALAGVEVCAFEAASGEFAACAQTGTTGHYALQALAAASYKVGFSLEFEAGFGNDGYLSQYYNDEPTFAAANAISVTPPTTVSGIDAHLLSSSQARSVLPAPAPTVPVAALPAGPVKRHLACKKGFHRKTVKGMARCVKARHRRRHKRPHH